MITSTNYLQPIEKAFIKRPQFRERAQRVSHANGAGQGAPARERVGEFEGRSPLDKRGLAPGRTPPSRCALRRTSRTCDPRLRRPVVQDTPKRPHSRASQRPIGYVIAVMYVTRVPVNGAFG